MTTTPVRGRTSAGGARPATKGRPAVGRPATVRAALERDDIWDRMVRPGDRLPSATLLEADLGPIHLDRLLRTGPVALVFFRHAGSAPCEAALRSYQQKLLPVLDSAQVDSAHLVAVSPQVPSRLAVLKRRYDLGFFVASDVRHTLIDAFNLGVTEPGADRILGARHAVLPFPAVVVADRTGVVRYAEVSGSFPEPGAIVAALRTAVPVR